MLSKMKSLEEKLKELQSFSAYGMVDMVDLCLFSDLVIPPKFKIPESMMEKLHLYCTS